jgi:hypothetical protein
MLDIAVLTVCGENRNRYSISRDSDGWYMVIATTEIIDTAHHLMLKKNSFGG